MSNTILGGQKANSQRQRWLPIDFAFCDFMSSDEVVWPIYLMEGVTGWNPRARWGLALCQALRLPLPYCLPELLGQKSASLWLTVAFDIASSRPRLLPAPLVMQTIGAWCWRNYGSCVMTPQLNKRSRWPALDNAGTENVNRCHGRLVEEQQAHIAIYICKQDHVWLGQHGRWPYVGRIGYVDS